MYSSCFGFFLLSIYLYVEMNSLFLALLLLLLFVSLNSFFLFSLFSVYISKENENKPFTIFYLLDFIVFYLLRKEIHRLNQSFEKAKYPNFCRKMLYQEVYRLWQIHQKTHRSIRSLVAQSLYKVNVVIFFSLIFGTYFSIQYRTNHSYWPCFPELFNIVHCYKPLLIDLCC